MLENSGKYWTDGEIFASWGFYFKEETFLADNIPLFLEKYLAITLKYGINLPSLAVENETFDLERLKESYLKKDNPLRDLLLKRSLSESLDKYITMSCVFFKNEEKEIVKTVYKKLDFFSVIADFDEKCLKNYYMSLQTNAFFSRLETFNSNGESSFIDNSELAYLNTTRLNSYLRDLAILMFEFGESECSFSDDYQDYDENGKSTCFEDFFLLVNGDIIFYEDVYDLLPEEQMYKPFETIKVDLDETNYKKYLESRGN